MFIFIVNVVFACVLFLKDVPLSYKHSRPPELWIHLSTLPFCISQQNVPHFSHSNAFLVILRQFSFANLLV